MQGGGRQGIYRLVLSFMQQDEELRVWDLRVQSLGGGEPTDSQSGAADALLHLCVSVLNILYWRVLTELHNSW